MKPHALSEAAASAPVGSVRRTMQPDGKLGALSSLPVGSRWDLTTSEEMFRIVARLVLSMKPNEQIIGCTGITAEDPSASFALHTGVALARLGHGPVLVIDGNLRSPSMHDAIGAVRSPGLAELLQKTGGAGSPIRTTDVPNLLVLTAGDSAHLSPATLASPVSRDCFETFRSYRYVVMDVGPMLVSAESLTMASAADVIVAALAAGRRTRRELLRLLDETRLLRPRFLGVVLTEMA